MRFLGSSRMKLFPDNWVVPDNWEGNCNVVMQLAIHSKRKFCDDKLYMLIAFFNYILNVY